MKPLCMMFPKTSGYEEYLIKRFLIEEALLLKAYIKV